MKLLTTLVTPVGLPLTSQLSNVRYQPSTWVKLCELPSPYSFDEALLLCEESDGQWAAWVPDFGEMRLNPNQFYRLD